MTTQTIISNGKNVSVEQWFFKERKELLANLRNTNKLREELLERQRYILFTQNVCKRMGIHSIPTCTSLLLLHRLLLRWPPTALPPVYDLSATVIFLALKVEEAPRPLFHVIQHTLSERFSSSENLEVKESDTQVVEMRQRVLELERRCLVLLCFDLVVDNPYRHVQRFFHSLQEKPATLKAWKEGALAKIQTSYLSLIHLESSARHIAGACIHASCPPKKEIPHDLLLKLFKLETTDVFEHINELISGDLDLLKSDEPPPCNAE